MKAHRNQRLVAFVSILTIGGVAQARHSSVTSPQTDAVVICMPDAAEEVDMPPQVIPAAKAKVTRLYAQIGVPLVWRPLNSKCPDGALRVSTSTKAPATISEAALGRAYPFDGTKIDIFLDRIVAGQSLPMMISLTAFVLAHEIAHNLQGIDRHSVRGIMSSRWTLGDYVQILWCNLKFTPEDISLIHSGIARRHSARDTLTSVSLDN